MMSRKPLWLSRIGMAVVIVVAVVIVGLALVQPDGIQGSGHATAGIQGTGHANGIEGTGYTVAIVTAS
jgi:preprotein translocase subunit SecG